MPDYVTVHFLNLHYTHNMPLHMYNKSHNV